ncbi:hypothetical protein V6N13_113891 [Hibiscus sabdariffa]
MTSTSGKKFYESQSITKPSFFNGDNYPYWKNRMMLFIKSNDYQVKVDTFDEERRKMQVNDKALHMLFCALGPDMYSKISSYTIIVNGLKGLREVIPEDKLVRKLLYSPPESWDSKRNAIIEAKDLKTLKLDTLMGSLLTHEIMKQGREEEKKREEKKLEKNEVEKKKIGITLKASQEESDSREEDSKGKKISRARARRKRKINSFAMSARDWST